LTTEPVRNLAFPPPASNRSDRRRHGHYFQGSPAL
jgi:hypothetical protein